jgi:hypothetical protein
MSNIIFSQSSIFHLYRLGHLACSSTGVRHRLSDELSMLMLIKHCSTSADSSVVKQFSAFLSTVDEPTISLLIAKKIIPLAYQRMSSIENVA